MAFQRGIDGSEPLRPGSVSRTGPYEERRSTRTGHVATGTLACPECDAPVVLEAPAMTPGQALACAFCGHGAPLRDFLSLAVPTRPTRVSVVVRR